MRALLCGLPLLLFGCTDVGGNIGKDGGLLNSDDEEFVTAHNVARINATPKPSPELPIVARSTTIAATAQAYADQCDFKHNAARGNLGENLFANTGQNFSPTQVVQGWEAEKADYDYATNTCASGKQCGHYTQVVWRDSVQLGCGMKICKVNSPFGIQFPEWQLWVCNYGPPGNYTGQKPY